MISFTGGGTAYEEEILAVVLPFAMWDHGAGGLRYGADGGIGTCRENGGFDMLLITEEGEIWITEGIAEQFTLNEGRTETIRVLGA